MKKSIKRVFLSSAVVTTCLAFASCDVEKTEEGDSGDVDVDVEKPELPEYDVDAPDVKVGTEEVEVPDTIEVPDVDIIPADEDTDDE